MMVDGEWASSSFGLHRFEDLPGCPTRSDYLHPTDAEIISGSKIEDRTRQGIVEFLELRKTQGEDGPLDRDLRSLVGVPNAKIAEAIWNRRRGYRPDSNMFASDTSRTKPYPAHDRPFWLKKQS